MKTVKEEDIADEIVKMAEAYEREMCIRDRCKAKSHEPSGTRESSHIRCRNGEPFLLYRYDSCVESCGDVYKRQEIQSAPQQC